MPCALQAHQITRYSEKQCSGKLFTMEEIKFIESFLLEAGVYVREMHGRKSDMDVSTKKYASDILTEADLEVQRRCVLALQQAFPDDQLVAEEEGYDTFPDDPEKRCWVLDPIDGTNNFMRALFPMFGISLAFVDKGIVQAGGVYLPVSGDLFLAERGNGATHNGKRISVSEISQLSAAKIEMDLGWTYEREDSIARGYRLLCAAGQMRCHGVAVVSLCQVARGDMDAFFHNTLNPWDYAASLVIVEEAGGMATRLDNTPLHLFDGGSGVLMSNSKLHEEIVCLLENTNSIELKK